MMKGEAEERKERGGQKEKQLTRTSRKKYSPTFL
jgi:hypothetical protein